MGYRFETFKSKNGQYYWRFVASNNETMCHSEGYITKQSAEHAVSVMKSNAAIAGYYDLT